MKAKKRSKRRRAGKVKRRTVRGKVARRKQKPKRKVVKKRSKPKVGGKPRASRKRRPKKREKPKRIRAAKLLEVGIVSVFGNRVDPKKIRNAAREACRRKKFTIDDIHVHDFIRREAEDNLMVKITILDHIEEFAFLMFPKADIVRTNKITLEISQ